MSNSNSNFFIKSNEIPNNNVFNNGNNNFGFFGSNNLVKPYQAAAPRSDRRSPTG